MNGPRRKPRRDLSEIRELIEPQPESIGRDERRRRDLAIAAFIAGIVAFWLLMTL
jgi:hypothetical protein